MKKITVIVLLIISLLCFSGCGTSKDSQADTKASKKQTEQEEKEKEKEKKKQEDAQKAEEDKKKQEKEQKQKEAEQKQQSRREEVIAYEKEKFGYSDSEANPSNSQYKCEYCGVSNVYLIRDGVCRICYDEQIIPTLPKCQICGTALEDNMTTTLGRCYNCMVCDYCGTSLEDRCADWTLDTIDGTWTCDTCYYQYKTPMCAQCGRNPQDDFSTGLCNECGGYNYCSLCGAYMPNGFAVFNSGMRFCQSCVDTYGAENVFNVATGQ